MQKHHTLALLYFSPTMGWDVMENADGVTRPLWIQPALNGYNCDLGAQEKNNKKLGLISWNLQNTVLAPLNALGIQGNGYRGTGFLPHNIKIL